MHRAHSMALSISSLENYLLQPKFYVIHELLFNEISTLPSNKLMVIFYECKLVRLLMFGSPPQNSNNSNCEMPLGASSAGCFFCARTKLSSHWSTITIENVLFPFSENVSVSQTKAFKVARNHNNTLENSVQFYVD